MNYEKPELQSALASEYVLGTLTGKARERFEKLLPHSSGLQAAVADWQQYLMPLAQQVKPVTPPAELWQGIQSRVSPTNTQPGFKSIWDNIAFWRGFGLSASALMLAIAVFGQQIIPGANIAEPVAIAEKIPTHLAVLSDQQNDLKMVVSLENQGQSMIVRAASSVPAAEQLKLWCIEENGNKMPIGVIKPNGDTRFSLNPQQLQNLLVAHKLEVTREPVSPETSLEVLYEGDIIF